MCTSWKHFHYGTVYFHTLLTSSNLKLESQTKDIVDSIKAMELEKRSLEKDIVNCEIESKKLTKTLKPVKKEREMIQSMISEMSSLEVVDVDNEQVGGCVQGCIITKRC